MKKNQKELNNLYSVYLSKLIDDEKFNSYLSKDAINSPLLIGADVERGNYYESDIKILFVGKENNGWFGLGERNNKKTDINDKEKYLQDLVDYYCQFNLGEKYKTPFFTFMDILIGKFKETNLNVGVLWSNLLRIDCGNDLKKEIIDIDKNQILIKEIEILNPDLVLFLTGPNYDNYLNDTFVGVRKISIENKGLREICMLKHADLPLKALRVYHPDYYSILGADYRHVLADTIKNIMQ